MKCTSMQKWVIFTLPMYFYNFDENINRKWAGLGAMAVEMETAGLFLASAVYKKRSRYLYNIRSSVS